MKRLKLVITILLVLCIAVGCQKSETSNKEETSEILSLTQYKEQLTELISVDATVTIPDSAKDGMVKTATGVLHDFSSSVEYLQQLLGSQTNIRVNTGYVSGWTEYSFNVLNTLWADPQFDDYNADLYLAQENLSFMPKTDAFEKVKTILNDMGVMVSDKYTGYAMDYRIMEQEEDRTDAGGNENSDKYKSEWTEDDNCYYFWMQQSIDDIDIFGDDVFSEGYIPGEFMTAMYSKDGLREISMAGCYDIEEGDEVSIISVDKALDVVKEKYDSVISTNIITITDIELCMKTIPYSLNNKRVSIVPAWKIKVKTQEQNNETEPYSNMIFINAETGKEII